MGQKVQFIHHLKILIQNSNVALHSHSAQMFKGFLGMQSTIAVLRRRVCSWRAPTVLSLSAHLSQDPWEPGVPLILRVNHCDARALLAHSVLSWLRMGLREKAAYTSALNLCSSLPIKGRRQGKAQQILSHCPGESMTETQLK